MASTIRYPLLSQMDWERDGDILAVNFDFSLTRLQRRDHSVYTDGQTDGHG